MLGQNELIQRNSSAAMNANRLESVVVLPFLGQSFLLGTTVLQQV